MTGIPNHTIYYYDKNGRLHRTGGPAEIGYVDGRIEAENWYIHGEAHREDGPALYDEDMGLNEWYWDGLPHRYYGPQAIGFGSRYYWALHGLDKAITKHEHKLPDKWEAYVWNHFHRLGNGYGMTVKGLDGKSTRTGVMRKLLETYEYRFTLEQIQQVWEILDEAYEMDSDISMTTINYTYLSIISRLFFKGETS